MITFLDDHLGHQVEAIEHDRHDPVEMLREQTFDLVLLDLNLPDDLAADIIRFVSDALPTTKVVLLIADPTDHLLECIAAGVHGCVLEQASIEELIQAIDRVHRGDVFCSPELIATMFRAIANSPRTPRPPAAEPPATKRLSFRELEVLELLNQRKSNKEIASALSISLFTVKNHVRNILEKLNVESRMEAVDVARRQRTVGW